MGSFLEDVFSPASGLSDLSGGDDAVFGTKPKIAPFVPIDTSAEVGKAIDTNVANFDAITAYLNKLAPGFTDLLTKGLGTSSDLLGVGTTLLHGEIPDDVKDQVLRSAAFTSLMGGYGGTPMSKALAARDLGLTSLNLLQTGAGLIGAGGNAAQLWTNQAEQAYSPFTISAPFQTSVTAGNNAGEQATEQFKFNVAAAPDPAALAKFNTNVAIGQQLVGVVGGVLGGSGGGSTAAPTGSANWSLIGGAGNQPAFQYNSATGQYQAVPAAQPVGAWGYSDARLKRIVKFIRTSGMGIKVYRFLYRASALWFEGVVAQQVQRVCPDAVFRDHDGYLRVDYSRLDVRPRLVMEG
jgi:hypothetical protein